MARSRVFWTVAPLSFLGQGVWIAYQSLWAGEWLRQIGGRTDASAAVILTGLALAVIVGQLAFGFLADRFARQNRAFFRMTAGLCAAFVAIQIGLLLHPEGYGGALWVAFGVLTAGPIFGYALLTRLVPTTTAGSAIALLNFFGVLCGALFQSGIGFVVESWPDTMPVSSHQGALAVLVALQIAALLWMLSASRKEHLVRHEDATVARAASS